MIRCVEFSYSRTVRHGHGTMDDMTPVRRAAA